jgi:nucleoside-diphosphate-sugar epimerase
MAANDKPKVLILGGVGFIGRNLVEYLADNNLVSKIKVADKVLPDLAGLSAKQQALFKSDLVEFKQANLAREQMVVNVFDQGGPWDFVINLAGETKFSQTDEVYKENIIDVSTQCATQAAKRGVKKFIEVSTAQVYEEGKKPSDESGKTKPWTKLAKAKLLAEESLRSIPNLPLIIVRPAVVYGPGDITGITPRLIAAAVYKHLNETMDFLWDKDLAVNTVHVRDVCAALWHLIEKGKIGDVYNLADQNGTNQGAIAQLIEVIFGIKTSFFGYLKSKAVTSVAMKVVAETANEKHLKPWSDLCKAAGITNTPLTPYLDEELLYNDAYSIDGTKIKDTGFTYQYPQMTEALLREVIKYFVDLNFFPPNLA